MKGTIIGVAIVATLLPISSARAVGLTLNWGGCIGAGERASENFACWDPEGVHKLVFEIQPPTVLGFFAVDISLDLEVHDQGLSSFWHMESNGCNGAGLAVSADRSTIPRTGCLSTFTGSSGSNVSALITAYGAGYGGANRARILITVARSAASPINLLGGSNYYLSHLIFTLDRAVEAGGGCVGCNTAAGIAWESATLYSVEAAGANRTEAAPVEVSGRGLGTLCVSINGCGTGPCSVTPVRNRSWGSIKSMYR